jgi:hypothetical protein
VECLDDLSVLAAGARRPVRGLDLAAGEAGDHLGGVGRLAQDMADLVERDREHIVQDERQPLARAQRVEHHEQGEADRIGQRHLLVRRRVLGGRHHQVRGFLPVGGFGAGSAGSQQVQAEAADHGGQPARQVGDGRLVLADETHPGILDDVLGVGVRAQHAVRDGAQPVALGLERLGHPVGRVDCHGLRC